IGSAEFAEYLPGIVRAEIVGDYDFVRHLEWLRGVTDRGDERAKIVLLVVAWNDKAEVGQRGARHAPRSVQGLRANRNAFTQPREPSPANALRVPSNF